MKQNIAINNLKFIFVELFGNFVYFPLWWYTSGLVKVFFYCSNSVLDLNKRLGVAIWIKNILVPMFSQYDWQGRIISFFMRLGQIIGRSVILAVASFLIFSLLIIYLLLPFFVISMIFYNMGIFSIFNFSS